MKASAERPPSRHHQLTAHRESVMSRHTTLPGPHLTALYLLHAGSMDVRLISLSVERHWKHAVRLVPTLDEARVVLVDCDRPGVEAAFEQLGPYPSAGIVCYAFHPKDHALRFPNRLILGKPLNLDALPGILAKAANDTAAIKAAVTARRQVPAPVPTPPTAAVETPSSLGHGLHMDEERDLCGAMDDIPLTPGTPLSEKLFFAPDQYLIGHLSRAVEQAVASGRPHVISGLPRLIGVQPQPLPMCVTAFRGNQLRPFSMAQLPHATARIVSALIFSESVGTETVYAAEDFLWNIAAWAARGRLPVGTDPYQRVRLKAWPNFTQAFVSPHALRIAALWTRTWASPVEIATQLAIPHRYVFSVFSSAHFSGLLDRNAPTVAPIAVIPVAAQPSPPPKQEQRPSILSRILRKLLNAV